MTKRNASRARPVGAIRTTARGYVDIKTVYGWMRRSRNVMELHLGRKLLATEDVHHKNEIKDDDRVSNLEVVDHVVHMLRHHLGKKRGQKALANLRSSFERRSTSRINHALAASIRMRVSAGTTQRAISSELGVSPMTVNRIVHGKSWKPRRTHG